MAHTIVNDRCGGSLLYSMHRAGGRKSATTPNVEGMPFFLKRGCTCVVQHVRTVVGVCQLAVKYADSLDASIIGGTWNHAAKCSTRSGSKYSTTIVLSQHAAQQLRSSERSVGSRSSEIHPRVVAVVTVPSSLYYHLGTTTTVIVVLLCMAEGSTYRTRTM
jgi:hypothetical protein